MITLAISVAGHDASITLLYGSELITTFSCERISRKKHTGKVEQCDINIIADIYTKQVDQLIIVNTSPNQQSEVIKLIDAAGIKFKSLIVDNENHHLFHAAASYYPLGLDDAICIVIDGAGSIVMKDNIGQLSEVTTFFHVDKTIKTIYKKFFYRSKIGTTRPGYTPYQIEELKQKFPYPIELTTHPDAGQMYGTITRYIGFTTMEAGKTMGLSAYGNVNNLPPILIPGTCLTNNNLFRSDKQIDLEVNPELLNINDTIKKNMAYNVQQALEKMFIEKVTKALTFASSKNIIISGGCALNILGNSLIKKTFKDHNVYAEPIGTDSAQSLGAAYYYYKKFNPNAKFKKFTNLYHGPSQQVQHTDIERLVRYYNESTL